MLVNISKKQLCLGMFVEAVPCPITEFSKRRFILTSRADLDAILRSSATFVEINTAMGLGQAGDDAAKRGAMADRRTAEVKEAVTSAVSRLENTLTDMNSGKYVEVGGLASVSSGLSNVMHHSPDVLMKVTRLKRKDTATYLHSVAVGALMMRVGQIMELSDDTVGQLGMAGLVHDVGKLRIADQILQKPGKLAQEERDLMQQHPRIGHDLLLAGTAATPVMLDVCLMHHELLDGSGYPDGLTASDIPVHCRIATVCDVFEALTSDRPYKTAWSAGKALKWLYEQPHLFDYRVVGRMHEGLMSTSR